MEHYYSAVPTSLSEERQIVYSLEDREFRFWTDHGVFSMERVDHGSDILIRAVRKEEPCLRGEVVDLGCGYGPIGISLAPLNPLARFRLIDVNDRAMDLARRNAMENGVEERVLVGTAQTVLSGSADAVITNPPIRAGKAVIYDLFRQAHEWLKPGGRLYVVIRKNQGAPSAAKELETIFGDCETVARQSGFHVLRCQKRAAAE